MTIMDLIRKWKDSKSETSEKYKELEENQRLQHILAERSKSANQRELESFYKKQEEAQIKKQLDIIRQKQTKEAWKNKSLYGGKGTVLKSDKNIMSGGKSILNQKNIFLTKHSEVFN